MCTCACIAGGVWAEPQGEPAEEAAASGASASAEMLLQAPTTPLEEETATDPILAEPPVTNATLADILATEVKPEEPVRKKSKLKSAQIALELPIRVRGVFE